MSVELSAVRFGARDPETLGRFWAGVLRWDVMPSLDGEVVVRGDDSSYALRFTPAEGVKTRQNRIHLDLTSQSPADQQAIVERALALGGRHIDIGQSPDDDQVVLADPEGNELCVIEAGNGFLAGCGPVGAVNCDGTQTLGYFWSNALGWPLVWDQDEETAVQSPRGGSKVTWSGPPLMPRDGTTPIELEVTVLDGDLRAEVERLVGLGASIEQEPSSDGRVVLLDPDGNCFDVRLPR